MGKRKIDRLDFPSTKFASSWTGHLTEPVAGFLCVGKRRETTCTRGLLGYDDVTRRETLFAPDLSECLDARIKYVEHHTEASGFPYPPCSWMATHTSSMDIIHIEPHTSEYDPFRDSYKDHSFHTGHCIQSPCLLTTRDGYWFNTTDPTKSCEFGDLIELKMTSDYTSGSMHKVQFMSLSLLATDFRGSCKMSICEKEGIRLGTNEWVSFSDVIVGDIPPCVNGSSYVNTMTSDSILRHLVSEYEYSEDYRRCQQLKEKLMTKEGVTRSDISSDEKQEVDIFSGGQKVNR